MGGKLSEIANRRTTPLTKYVNLLSHEERHAIVQSYEKFEQDGFIGDEPIRTYAEAFCTSIGIKNGSNITLWMDQLAKECFRFYYYQTFG